MIDTQRKALAQAVEAAGRRMQDYNIMAEENVLRQSIEAHARAIEQHEAFRQEVSEAVQDYIDHYRQEGWLEFDHFILPKPVDPLVEAMLRAWPQYADRMEACSIHAAAFRAAIEKRGGKIVWGEG